MIMLTFIGSVQRLLQLAYVRLDDARNFFGFTNITPESDPNNYSYLCPDSHLQPLSVENPCTWISKPWPAIAAKRTHAEKVTELFSNIDRSVEWQRVLLQLLESFSVNVTLLPTSITIDDYLDLGPGYQSAHSFPECDPPRQIVFCTTSLKEFSKCTWLQEVANVYGIEPNLQCVRGENQYRCLNDVAQGTADLVAIDQASRFSYEEKFNLIPILYEYAASSFTDNYVTIAVVKEKSKIFNFAGKFCNFHSIFHLTFLFLYRLEGSCCMLSGIKRNCLFVRSKHSTKYESC